MKFFLDTEFIEDGRTIDLISIGIVCEDGREFYRQNADCKFEHGDDWVARNVYPHLTHFDMGRRARSCRVRTSDHDMSLFDVDKRCADPLCPWRSHSTIRDDLRKFVEYESPGTIEFWAYYADYDWVALCQLFGRMIDLPHDWPKYCNDLKQAWEDTSYGGTHPKDVVPQDSTEHNALADARWNVKLFNKIELARGRPL